MRRLLPIGAGLLLFAASSAGFQKGGAKAPKSPKEPPPSQMAPAAKAKPPGNSELKDPQVKNSEGPKSLAAPRLGTPGNPVERLMAMPPEQRERVLEKLPAGQQANLRARLDRFD